MEHQHNCSQVRAWTYHFKEYFKGMEQCHVYVSTHPFNMICTANNGAHLLTSISKSTAHIVGYAYIDETYSIAYIMRDVNIKADEIMQDIQDDIDHWKGGLMTTVGATVPDKSWVYPINFSFNTAGKWTYKTVEEIDVRLE